MVRVVLRWSIRVFWVVGIGTILLVVIFLITSGILGGVEKKATIPEMEIVLNGLTLEELNEGPKRVEYKGNELVLVDSDNEYVFEDVEIRGRGNASWLMDKKSYRIKMSQKTNLLGLGRLKKWGLISNNIDDTLMRNDLGQFVANVLYEDYPIHGEFVKLKIGEKDLGLYYLVNLVGVNKGSVDLKDPFGILVEIDNIYCEDTEKYIRTEIMGDCVVIDDVVLEDESSVALDIFMSSYKDLEFALKRKDFNDVIKRIDVESWAKYYLLSEFSSNPDAYVTSWFLYKDGRGDRINSNIGWDFDAAFGNWNWWDGSWPEGFYSPTELMTRMKYSIDDWDNYEENEVGRCKLLEKDSLISPTMCYMVAMPEFRELAGKIYREKLMNKREEIISYIREKADYIRDVAIANNELWGRGDFDEAVEYLIWWVDKRFDFFDDLYGRIELLPEES